MFWLLVSLSMMWASVGVHLRALCEAQPPAAVDPQSKRVFSGGGMAHFAIDRASDTLKCTLSTTKCGASPSSARLSDELCDDGKQQQLIITDQLASSQK